MRNKCELIFTLVSKMKLLTHDCNIREIGTNVDALTMAQQSYWLKWIHDIHVYLTEYLNWIMRIFNWKWTAQFPISHRKPNFNSNFKFKTYLSSIEREYGVFFALLTNANMVFFSIKSSIFLFREHSNRSKWRFIFDLNCIQLFSNEHHCP